MKYIVTINNIDYEVEVERGQATLKGTNEVSVGVVKSADGSKLPNSNAAPQSAMHTKGEGESLKAPMPGTILDIKVTQGSNVKKGEVLFILEAMKMENEITATKDGVVTQISVAKGALVATNDVLAVIQ
jgi:biotin carboxyl carrier protein